MLSSVGKELIGQSRYQEAIEVYERLFEQHEQLPSETLSQVFQTLMSLYGQL